MRWPIDSFPFTMDIIVCYAWLRNFYLPMAFRLWDVSPSKAGAERVSLLIVATDSMCNRVAVPLLLSLRRLIKVGRVGIEPTTPGLKVRCSTKLS